MSKALNAFIVRAAYATADKYNDATLANWANELAMHDANKYVSVDITNDELDDTFVADLKALGYDTETVYNMTDFEMRKTGRAFVYAAMEHAGNKTKVIAQYKQAIKRRSQWLKVR